ncbi:pyridoxal phosphate-dependent transferase [Tribonema minus]|uniref:Pyridoxal phosphate-dependent transferase n=1 Tax=Tribonema minus TaxID=303371 RepID=A0A835Z5Y9_9STRA|nr:pyridoxal phosphate-dependent transferase [Tribonema minus]
MRGLMDPTVWAEFTPLAVQHGAFNLGQGFPDWPCPDFCKQAVAKAVQENFNQYARSAGHPALVQVLAEQYSKLMGRDINGMTEVTVSMGCTEGLFAIWQALLSDGDEVVVFEPAFDVYAPQVQMAGGKCTFVPLKPDDKGGWGFDVTEFEAAFTNKTRAVLLNNPHNPTGKVFTNEELEALCNVVKKHEGVILVTDEVYERIIFDGNKHVYAASLDGMWDRTLTVSSAGKTFSTTGWKVGWVIGPEALVLQVMNVNQWVQYCVPTVLQQAVAEVLKQAEEPFEGHASYYAYLVDRYQRKRDRLVVALRDANIVPIVPEGGIFVVADTSGVLGFDGTIAEQYMQQTTPACPIMTRDWALCRWLTIEKGVCAIPPSTFYKPEHKHLAANLARFAFCKEDSTIEGAAAALHKLHVENSK